MAGLVGLSLLLLGAASAASVATADDLRFFDKNGWLLVKDLVPELGEQGGGGELTAAITLQAKRSKLAWARYSIGYLEERHRIKCTSKKNVKACGPPPDGFILPDTPDVPEGSQGSGSGEEVDSLTRAGVAFLECCIAVSKKRGEAKKPPKNSGAWARSDKHTATLPFYQALNLHRGLGGEEEAEAEEVLDAALSPALGGMASRLLQSDRVRLYQTAYFTKDGVDVKGAQNAGTGWHQDLALVPLDTRSGGYVSFWCPVGRALDRGEGDSLLDFASTSHRDVSLLHWYPSGNWQPNQVSAILQDRYGAYTSGAERLELGDCTAHHGWLYHKASAQSSRRPRAAVAFSYVSDEARVLPDLFGNTTRMHRPFTPEDEMTFQAWLSDLEPLGAIEHPLLPLAWPLPEEAAAGDVEREEREEDIDDLWELDEEDWHDSNHDGPYHHGL